MAVVCAHVGLAKRGGEGIGAGEAVGVAVVGVAVAVEHRARGRRALGPALIRHAAEAVEPGVLVAGVGCGSREVHHGERDVHFRSRPLDHRAGAEVLEGLERDGGRGAGLLAREARRPADRGVDARGISVESRCSRGPQGAHSQISSRPGFRPGQCHETPRRALEHVPKFRRT